MAGFLRNSGEKRVGRAWSVSARYFVHQARSVNVYWFPCGSRLHRFRRTRSLLEPTKMYNNPCQHTSRRVKHESNHRQRRRRRRRRRQQRKQYRQQDNNSKDDSN
ncbi:unnamed protein product, partial [Ectocarpus sp. 12 AP-2014]